MTTTGFLGIGAMGLPMCNRLLDDGQKLVIWTRTAAKADALVARSAVLCDSPADVFARCDVVFMMLADAHAADAVLARGTPEFAAMLKGCTLVQTGTTQPGYSEELGQDIKAAGGQYIEATVSGQTGPASRGELVMMTAGDAESVEALAPRFAPLISKRLHCGAVPGAMRMKLAVNNYLAGMVLGLAESFSFATKAGLDLEMFGAILEAGPMSSDFLRMKMPKLLAGDFSVQGSVWQATESLRMQTAAAAEIGAPVPMAELVQNLYERAGKMGLAEQDMIALVKVFDALDDREPT